MCGRHASPYHPVCSYSSAQAVGQRLMSKVWAIFQTFGFEKCLGFPLCLGTQDNRILFMFRVSEIHL